jgi:hypothetical protein
MINPGNLKKAVMFWKSRTLDRRVLLLGFLLAVLCLQANAEMVPKITSYCCMLFIPSSRFTFVTGQTMYV